MVLTSTHIIHCSVTLNFCCSIQSRHLPQESGFGLYACFWKQSAKPWCIPTFTSKHSLLPQTVLTTVFAPVYIDMTAAINHSSTPSLGITHLITSLVTLSKNFFQIHKAKIQLLFFNSKLFLHLSYNEMASVVPLPLYQTNKNQINNN